MDSTLKYYNQNADQFVQGTLSVDFKQTQDRFRTKLPTGAYILDFGCGSGRDTKYFLENGYQVDAADGSEELCKIASDYTGIKVKQMLFEELCDVDKYDGIWECSSIRKLYESCYRDNLHSIWAEQELYRKGNSEEEFMNILQKNMQPVYDSARKLERMLT